MSLLGLSVCASGRHAWMDPDNAERCCNGWVRQLAVACTGLGEVLPDGASSVSTLPGARCGFVWVPAPEEPPRHDNDHEVTDMDDHEQTRRRPDPWAPSRPRIESLAASCTDYLGRITRSLARGTDAHYVTDKAHQFRNTAGSLVDACHEATLDARRCGAEIELTFSDGEAYTDECARPRGHRGGHDARHPATPVERAMAEANELAHEAQLVADLLAWCTGPGGYDHTEDVDNLEAGLRKVGRLLTSTRSAVAALRARDTDNEPAEDLPTGGVPTEEA